RQVEDASDALLRLRMHVEAAIDFVDEPIETLGLPQVSTALARLQDGLGELLARAERGRRLRDGLHAVLLGPPNAGTGALLPALAADASALVADVAGTPPDVLRAVVRAAGLELVLADTAGLRAGGDALEREGMRGARAEVERA